MSAWLPPLSRGLPSGRGGNEEAPKGDKWNETSRCWQLSPRLSVQMDGLPGLNTGTWRESGYFQVEVSWRPPPGESTDRSAAQLRGIWASTHTAKTERENSSTKQDGRGHRRGGDTKWRIPQEIVIKSKIMGRRWSWFGRGESGCLSSVAVQLWKPPEPKHWHILYNGPDFYHLCLDLEDSGSGIWSLLSCASIIDKLPAETGHATALRLFLPPFKLDWLQR